MRSSIDGMPISSSPTISFPTVAVFFSTRLSMMTDTPRRNVTTVRKITHHAGMTVLDRDSSSLTATPLCGALQSAPARELAQG